VVRAADGYARVIIRRPHAYFFLQDTFDERGGIRSATPAGCVLADGTTAPIPGIYLLDENGEFLESVALTGATAGGDLVDALDGVARP
jgi:hypothetical protein